MELVKRGRRRANPNALDSNNFRLNHPDSVDSCIDRGTQALADTVDVTGFEFNGETFELDAAINVEEPAKIREALAAVIGNYENDAIVTVDYAGGDLIVTHVGELKLTKVVTSGTDVTMTRQCTTETRCLFKFSVVGAVTLNGATMANSPYAWSETPATNDTTAGTLKTDLEAAITGSSAIVSVNNTTEKFDVVLTADKDTEIVINEEIVTEEACVVSFAD